MNMPVNLDNITQFLHRHDAIQAAEWHDTKKLGWLLGPSIPLMAVVSILSVADKHSRRHPIINNSLAWIGPLLIHVIVPALDIIVGEDENNPPDSAMHVLNEQSYYKNIVYSFVPLHYLSLAVGAYRFVKSPLSPLARAGIVMTVGALNGIAFNTAHELGHKKGNFDRLMSKLSVAPTGYGHFVVEHNFGHHKRVSTPEDPASSRFGESYWQFLPRTVIEGFKSGIRIEKQRLARRGKNFWNRDNDILQSWLMSAGILGIATATLGKKVMPFFGISALYGFSLFEVINYIEHYGLKRQQLAQGGYERVQPEHSWNGNQIVSNLFLYQLQRHSDHHANPTRAYQTLRHFDDTPQLPTGYAGMVAPAYIPPLWFKLMNQRVINHYGGDMSRINMHQKNTRQLKESLADAGHYVASKGLRAMGKLLSRI